MSLTLVNSILNQTPTADRTALNELNELVERHNITWAPNKEGRGAWFIMSELAIAKGLDAEDYRKNWADMTTALKKTSSESLAGRALKLEGEQLASFKRLYSNYTGQSLGRVNSLWVGDWVHAHAYLVQGSSETAKDFQTLGANAIQRSVEQAIEEGANASTYRRGLGWSEEKLQEELILLSAHCGQYRLMPEQTVLDFDQSKARVRRYDLVEWQPHKTLGKVVTIYELKKDIIDHCDLTTTVEGKRYIELAKAAYKTQAVNLVMVAPYGGTPEARLKAIDYGVQIITAQDLAFQLIQKAKRRHPHDQYFVTGDLTERFKKLLSNPNERKVVPFTPRTQDQLEAA